MAQLEDLETWAAPLLAKLSTAEVKRLTHAIAKDLRASQGKRIAQQRNPDGTAYTPRKRQGQNAPGSLRAKKGQIKARLAMFAKLKTARYLKTKADAAGAEVGFTGRVARIAAVHQWGLRDKVEAHGPEVQYPARELLGFTPAELDHIQDLLMQHLAG